MESEELLIEREGSIAVLTLNRPVRRNALSTSLLISLVSALEELGRDRRTRCVVVRGAGDKSFSAGMDLAAMPDGVPGDLQKQIEAKGPLQYGLEAIETCPFPVIAMIRGFAVGAGCELAVACDLRVGAEGCRMGMPPARLGILYPPEGLQRFIRTVGLASTRKLFLTAEIFDTEEAGAMGLLDYIVPAGDIEETTLDIARGVAANAPLSVAGHKRSLYLLSRSAPLAGADLSEVKALAATALASQDAKEGLAAFIQKRDPVFTGE